MNAQVMIKVRENNQAEVIGCTVVCPEVSGKGLVTLAEITPQWTRINPEGVDAHLPNHLLSLCQDIAQSGIKFNYNSIDHSKWERVHDVVYIPVHEFEAIEGRYW